MFSHNVSGNIYKSIQRPPKPKHTCLVRCVLVSSSYLRKKKYLEKGFFILSHRLVDLITVVECCQHCCIEARWNKYLATPPSVTDKITIRGEH